MRIVAWLCLLAPLAASATGAEWARQRVGLLELETPRGHERSLIALAKSAPHILPRIEEELGVRIARRYRMVLIPPAGTGDSLVDDLDASVPPWAAGYMIPSRRLGAIRVALASRYPYGTLESVLAHETTHLLLHDAAGERLPAWFQEGVATWIGRRWSLEDAMVVSSALLTTALPHLSEVDSLFQASAGEARLAYATSFSFVSWSIARYGAGLPRDVLREARSRPIAEAWRAVTGEPLAEAELAWRRSSLIRYRWVPALLASSTLWLGITALALVAGLRRRAQAKRLREAWAHEDDIGAGEGSASSTRIARRVNAPRAAVYRALLDPRAVAIWKVPTGMTSHVHAFDAREGGSFRISLTYDAPTGAGKTTAHTDTYHGRFVRLVPNEQVVEVVEFETTDPALQGEMTITTTLADADGGTDLLAVHEGLPPGLSAADNEAGWREALAKLAALVESA